MRFVIDLLGQPLLDALHGRVFECGAGLAGVNHNQALKSVDADQLLVQR